MPIYEYACNECGHELEALQKMSDAPLVDCPACARPSLKKRISAAGFRLTGSGWYETDFKRKPQAKSESGDATGNKADGDKPSEDKPSDGKSSDGKASAGASAAKEAAA